MRLKLSELFYSLQGEGRYVGVPSIFMRTFGCNFTCGGFGMPRGEKSQERFAIDPKSVTKYSELPLVKTGCDSYASWDPRFKRLSEHFDIQQIGEMMSSLLPNGKFWTPNSFSDVHLVITGGEPLLGWQRAYPDLLEHLAEEYALSYVTFETNGTQLLDDLLLDFISTSNIKFTFSVSAKLSASGESRDEAIKPMVLRGYNMALWHQASCMERDKDDEDLYFKFVVDKPEDLLEVQDVMNQYQSGGVTAPVYLMPVGGTGDLYYENNKVVAKMAMERGWRYSPRIQVDLWKNAWGT